MLRHPWNRLQSDYYYLKSKPHSEHLGVEINTTHLLSVVHNVYEYTSYPGLSNCATKMLNGIQCAEDFELSEHHLFIAKQVLSAMLWFGITEYFQSSVCQFSWMYGGDPEPLHFSKAREGSYNYQTMQQALNESEQERVISQERFDLQLYEFAVETFLGRVKSTQCPLLDGR
jgi:hypothetical protein